MENDWEELKGKQEDELEENDDLDQVDDSADEVNRFGLQRNCLQGIKDDFQTFGLRNQRDSSAIN